MVEEKISMRTKVAKFPQRVCLVPKRNRFLVVFFGKTGTGMNLHVLFFLSLLLQPPEMLLIRIKPELGFQSLLSMM